MASSTNSAPPVAHARAGATRARGFLAHEWFYPAAALHAAIVLPLSVLALGGAAAGPAALSTPWAHAREMLTGFALAAIAGNQLPPMPVARGAVLLATWLAARACAITGLAAGPWLDAAFALALAARAVPRLVRSAKKWRNRALPALIASVCVAAVAAGFAHREAATPRAIADAFVLLLAALMLFMGGRIIAPAAAGQLYRQGDALAARVQPRIEAALLVAMAIAVTSALVPALSPLLAPACASAAALALARLLRWRLWAMRGRPDLLCFGAGYAWLVVGLGMLALAQTHAARASALHAITVGALGTLALNVMGNTILLKARRAAAGGPLLVAGTLLVAAAASFRIAAAFAGHAMALVGAACWSAAFAALLALAVRSRRSTAVTVGREGA